MSDQATLTPPAPAAPAAPASAPPIAGDTPFMVPTPDGPKVATSAQLVDRFNTVNRLQSELGVQNFDDATVGRLKIAAKAASGDPEALRSLIAQSQPTAPTAPPSPQDVRIEQLTKTVTDLQKALGQVTPVAEQIQTATRVSAVQQMVAAKPQEFPLLARQPVALHQVVARAAQLEGVVQQRFGMPMDQVRTVHPQIDLQIAQMAAKEVEGQLGQLLAPFGIGTPQPRQPGVVNDQRPQGTPSSGGMIRDANGFYHDPLKVHQFGGLQPVGPQPTQPGLPPAYPVASVPTGIPGTYDQGVNLDQKPFTMDDLRGSIRATVQRNQLFPA